MAQPRIAIDPIKPYGFTSQGISAPDYPQPRVAKPPAVSVSSALNPNRAMVSPNTDISSSLRDLVASNYGVGGQTINDIMAKMAIQDEAYRMWWATQHPNVAPASGPRVAIDPNLGQVSVGTPTMQPTAPLGMGWIQSLAGYHPAVDPNKVRPANPYGATGLPSAPMQASAPTQAPSGGLDLNTMLRNILG